MEHKYEENIKCPYCDYEWKDSWEFTEDDGTHTCGSCDREFNVTREIEITYSTSRIDCEVGGKKHNYQLKEHFTSKQEFEKGVWSDLPEDKWKYRRIEMCSECGDKEYIQLTKEEYNKELEAISAS